jgi:hypothetical protein
VLTPPCTAQKTFIIATLISTIAGTFTTGINLYDRVQDKREQKRTDHHQDEKIDQLEKRVNEAEGEKEMHKNRATDLRRSLQYGGPQIQREYDQDYARMGSRFAQGDCECCDQPWPLRRFLAELQADGAI